MQWEAIETVLAIARGGSLSAAAAVLEVDPSTVYRRLGALERELGARLFVRDRTGYTLTPFGEEVRERGEVVEAHLRDLERLLGAPDGAPAGRVVLTAPESALPLLVPAIVELRRRFPKVELCGEFEDAFRDLARREADVALRFSPRPPEDLIGRRIGPVAWALYAATHEVDRAEALPWAGFTEALEHVDAVRWADGIRGAAPVLMSVSSVPAMAAVLAAGGLRGVLPCFVGDADPGLQRVGEPSDAAASALWLLYHRDLKGSTAVRTVVDHLEEHLKGHADRLAGVG